MKIGNFFKQVLVTFTGFILALLFLGFLAFLLVFQIPPHTNLTQDAILELNIQQVVELRPASILEHNHTITDLHTIQTTLQKAEQDKHIQGIYLNVSDLQADWAILEELRHALLKFKQTGKPIIAYGNSYSQKAYYVASIADKIMIHPYGQLELKGLAVTVNFYTNLFKNISIDSTILRIGEYKSALEPFYLNKMSNESRQQTQRFLNDIYTHFLTNISNHRNIAIPKLKNLVNNLSATLPTETLQNNLTTHIGYEQDAKALFNEALSSNETTPQKNYNFIPYHRYALIKEKATGLPKIAVMIAEGTIIHGYSSLGFIGSKDFSTTIQALTKDPSIKAVVLRINSPGGNFFDSDIMWKAIEELKQHKPIVASMSNFAASGGYYIAAPCNYIFAQPTTLTGSIGIFGLLIDPTRLMQKIGIEKDVVKTAPSADFLSPRTTCSNQELKVLYKCLQQGYDAFLEKVSTGRKLDLHYVKKNIASGQVFTGIAAQKNKLVDELGGLDAALAKAADLAKLTENYAVCYLPSPKSKLEILFNYIISNIKMYTMFNGTKDSLLSHIKTDTIHPYDNIQAILPYTIDID